MKRDADGVNHSRGEKLSKAELDVIQGRTDSSRCPTPLSVEGWYPGEAGAVVLTTAALVERTGLLVDIR